MSFSRARKRQRRNVWCVLAVAFVLSAAASGCSDDTTESPGETTGTNNAGTSTNSGTTSGSTGTSSTNTTGTNNSTTSTNNNGTTTGTNNGSTPVSCRQDSDCRVGEICLSDVCVDGCRSDQDCASDEYCLAQECMRIGEGCRSDDDCLGLSYCDLSTLRCVDDDGSCREDADEPNDNLAEAGALPEGVSEALYLCDGDNDYYNLELEVGDALVVTARFEHAVANIDLQLLDERGRPLIRSTTTDDDERLEFEATSPGTYYVRVFADGDAMPTSYVLETALNGSGGDCEADAAEPNGSVAEATPLSLGTRSLGLCPLDEDWFVADLEAGQQLDVSATATGGEPFVRLELFDAALPDTPLRSSGPSATASLAYSPTANGRYAIRVSAAPGAPERLDYTLTASLDGDMPPQGCDDQFEPNDSQAGARLLEPGSWSNLASCEAEDDFYAIELGGLDTITATISFSDVTADLDMTLLDPNGSSLDSSTSTSDSESVSATVDASGTYYVRVYHFSGDPNVYSLDIRVDPGPEPPECDDAYEPDNTLADAGTLPPAGVFNATVCPGDDDHFQFENAAAGSRFVLTSEFDTLFGDVDLVLIDPDGSVATQATTRGTPEVLDTTLDAVGTWTVRVELGAGQTTSYGLTWELTAPPSCDGDLLEPNDTIEEASPAQGLLDDQGMRVCEGDADWFVIEVPEGPANVTFQVNADTDFGAVSVTLLAADGLTELDEAAGGDVLEVNGTELEAGSYYARVELSSGFVASYTIATTVVSCGDALEPNNTQEEAYPIAESVVIEDISLCDGLDDDDFYAVELNPLDSITVNVSFVDAVADIDLQLLNADGGVVDSSGSTSDNESVELEVQTQGTYYIRVYHFSGDPNTYTLDVQIDRFVPPPCEDVLGEPDNAVEDAQPVQNGSAILQSICFADEDWFVIEGVDGLTLVAELFFAHADGDLAIDLLDADGETVLRAVNSEDDDEVLTWRMREGVVYYLRVRGVGEAANAYTLTTTFADAPPVGPCSDRFEPNNSRLEAVALDSGVYEDLDLCDGEDDDDFYAVELGPRDEVTAVIRFTDATADLDLAFQSSTGSVLDSSTSVNDEETVTYTATEAGTYYIRAYHFSGDPNGYTLELDIDRFVPPTCDDTSGEPDDDAGNARSLFAPDSASAQICFGDADWYAVQGQPDLILVADVSFTHEGGDLAVDLLDADGVTVLRTADSADDDERLAWLTRDDQVYYLRVRGNGEAVNTYTLDVSFTDTPPVGPCSDRFEPNNSRPEALPIEEGTYEDLDLCDGEDDDDWYAIALNAGDTITIDVLFSDDIADIDLQLYEGDVSFADATSGSTTDNEQIVYTAEASVVHYIRVYHYAGDPNTYTLDIQVDRFVPEACEDDGREDDDTPGDASFVDVGTYNGQICFADDDWYLFAAGPGITLEASLTHDGGLEAALFSENDTTTPLDTFTSTLTYDFTEESLYYLRVSPEGTTQAAYTLGVGLVAGQ